MEISGVGSLGHTNNQNQVSLTDDQKKKLEEILSKYDSANLSADDAKSMFDEIKAAGIPRCKDTMEILKENGFTPPKPPDGHMPPPPPDDSSQTSALTSDQRSTLMDLIEKLKNGSLSEKDFVSELSQLESNGTLSSGSVINQTV